MKGGTTRREGVKRAEGNNKRRENQRGGGKQR